MRRMTPEEEASIRVLVLQFANAWRRSRTGQDLAVAAAQRFAMAVLLHYAANDMALVEKNTEMFIRAWRALLTTIKNRRRPQGPPDLRDS